MGLNFTYPMGYPGGPGGGGGYVMGGSPAYGFSDPFSGFPQHVSHVFFCCMCVFLCTLYTVGIFSRLSFSFFMLFLLFVVVFLPSELYLPS